MKSKQLANVLIKIIGLYVCLCAIPGFVSGVLNSFIQVFGPDKLSVPLLRFISYPIGDVVEAAVGLYLIINSQRLAEYWFKNETE